VQSYTYALFGELLAAQGTRSSALQYTGEQKDVDTGLVYLRARWYDSATGRFTTRDPFPGFVVLPQTLHPYVYVNNNPVNLTDPSGEIPIETLFDIVVFAVDIGIYVWDALNPALDHCTRMSLLGIDLAALGVDGLALVIPYLPGGGGLAGRLAGRGLLMFAQSGARASAGLRIIQIGAKTAQASTYLARTGGRGGGTRGVVGGGRKEGHHPWPQYLQGPKQQELYNFGDRLHRLYHQELDRYLPRKLGKDFYRQALNSQQKVNELLEALLEFNRYFDGTHGTHTFELLEDELINQGLLPRP
jgi:RHS repeat-associated protein